MLFFFQIPVFKGSAKPILGECIDAGDFHGKDGLGDAPDPNAPGLDLLQKEGAVSAIIRIVNENPGEVRGVFHRGEEEGRGGMGGLPLSGLSAHVYSPGDSGCHGTAHQPGSGCEDGPVSTEQTPRALHHGRKH